MTAAVRHARPGLFARLRRPAPVDAATHVTGHFTGIGAGTEWHPRPGLGKPHGIATPETLARIVAEVQETVTMAAPLAETEPWDKPEHLFLDERDILSPLDRAYVPPPAVRVLDVFADISELPGFRETIRATMQRGCTECGRCGRTVPGWDWPERFAAQLAHLANGVDAPSSGTGRLEVTP